MPRYPSWGFGDVSQPDTIHQHQQATAVALQTAASMGPAAPGGGGITDAQGAMKRAMIATAIEIAAVQLSITIILKCVTLVVPIGTIIGAVLSVIQYIGGEYSKRKVREIIGNSVNQIKATALSMQTELLAAANAIADQEWPNAQAIASSTAPLNGWELGSWLNTEAELVARPLVKTGHALIKAASTVYFDSAEGVLKLIGDNRDADLVAKKQREWDNFIAKWGTHLTAVMGDPLRAFVAANVTPMKYVIGTEGIETAKSKCGGLVAAANAQFAQMHAQAVATMATDAFRQQLRINLAKLIRGDPDMLAKAKTIAQIDAQTNVKLAQVDQAAAQGKTLADVSAKSGTGIFGFATIVAIIAAIV